MNDNPQQNNPDLSTKLKLVGVDVRFLQYCSSPDYLRTFIQVASFGDYFADSRKPASVSKPATSVFRVSHSAPSVSEPLSHNQVDPNKPVKTKVWEVNEPIGGTSIPTLDDVPSVTVTKRDASSPRKRHGAAAAAEAGVETLTYRDPFGGVYKKYIFSADGKYLLGGMMVGDTFDYVKLLALVKKKVREQNDPAYPSELIIFC